MSTLKGALKEWEEREGQRPVDAEVIKLCGWLPPIEKMDAQALSHLKKCKSLSLSTNNISNIGRIDGMESLEVLSLGRNTLTKLDNTDSMTNLRQLWLSFNKIDNLVGIEKLKNLRTLYMSNNRLSDWQEIDRLRYLPNLTDLSLSSNPIEVITREQGGNWRVEVIKRLPKLKIFDGVNVTQEELYNAKASRSNITSPKSTLVSPKSTVVSPKSNQLSPSSPSEIVQAHMDESDDTIRKSVHFSPSELNQNIHQSV
ncbi:dynein light chain [Acrasis kona]|uniref:Dynein axonemal light chain 1 n=1 Tax=Acrasis kona TaxID=1008807 RepID=A0AAW2Z2H8_9EUKA